MRPKKYTDDTVVCVDTSMAMHRLQAASTRRALVDQLIELGGRATIGDLSTAMKFDTTDIVAGLVRTGWLRIL